MAQIFSADFSGADRAAVIASITNQDGITNLDPNIETDILLGGGPSGGNAINIAGSKYLKYPIVDTPNPNRFNLSKGAIQMWVKLNWSLDSPPLAYNRLLTAYWASTPAPNGSKLELWINNNGLLYFYPRFFPADITRSGGVYWNDGEWNLLELYWDTTLGSGSYMLWKMNCRYANLINFTPTAAPDPLEGTPVVYIGSRHETADKLDGQISSIKFWDEPADLMPVAPADFPIGKFYDPWFPDDPLKNEARIRSLFPDGDGFISNWETHATNPIDCPLLDAGIHPGEDVLFFKKPHLENVYEGCVPTTAEIDDPFTWKGNPGETITLFFNVHTRIALTNPELNYTLFSGSPGTIAKSAMDLRVVKNWWQGTDDGGYAHQTIPTYMGFLMLKDETIALETDQTLGPLKCPTLPPTTDNKVITKTIEAATSRQFGLIVNIPSDAAAGDYACTVTLTADGGVEVTKVLTLNILPFVLQEQSEITNPFFWPTYEYPLVTHMGLDRWDIFQKQLAVLKNMGHKGLSLSVYDPLSWPDAPGGTSGIGITHIDTAINYIAAAGFKALVIYGVASGSDSGLTNRYTQGLVDLLNASGIEYTYLKAEDEFDHQTLNPVTGLVNQTVAINTEAKTLTLQAGNWTSYGFVNQSGQLVRLFGCTSPGNDGVYTTSYLSGNVLYYSSTTAPNPVTEAGNGSQTLMDNHWVLQIQKSKHINSLGGKVYVCTERAIHSGPYVENLPTFNAANYPLPGDPAGDASFAYTAYNGDIPSVRLEGVAEGYYFQARDGMPLWQRYNVGYQPYISNVRVTTAAINTYGDRCWNEFRSTYCAEGIMFPSVAGAGSTDFQPIPTYNAQAQREGIRDAKYLATWQYWYDQIKRSRPAEAAASKEEIDGIKVKYTGLGFGANNKYSCAEWDADREVIISEILTLKDLRIISNGLVGGVIPKKVGGKKARKVAGVEQ